MKFVPKVSWEDSSPTFPGLCWVTPDRPAVQAAGLVKMVRPRTVLPLPAPDQLVGGCSPFHRHTPTPDLDPDLPDLCLLTTGHRSTGKRGGNQEAKLSPLPQRPKVMWNWSLMLWVFVLLTSSGTPLNLHFFF